MRRARSLVAVAALLAGVLGTVVPATAMAATVASPDSFVRLPLDGYSDLLVDPAHGADAGHLIVSGWNPAYGGTRTGVVETNLDGSGVQTIGTLTHARALTIAADYSRVFAALDDNNAIAAFDPSDAQNVTLFPTGATTCPQDVAAAGDGKVWFTYGCDTRYQDIGVLDPTDGSLTTGLATGLFGRTLAGARLTNSPLHPNSLVIAESSDSGIFATVSVSGVTATAMSQTTAYYPTDFEVAADGQSVLVTSGRGPGGTATRYSMSDLSSLARYTSTSGDTYSQAVAASDDGSYVAVAGAAPDGITTFGPDSTTPVRRYIANYMTNIEGRGSVVWLGHTLVNITTDAMSRQPALNFYAAPTAAASVMTLTGPATHTRATALSLTGTLTSRGTPIGGASISVSQVTMDGRTNLPDAITNSQGQFSIADTPTIGGNVEYLASYAGDDLHQAVRQSIGVAVSRSTPYLAIATDHTLYSYGQYAVVTASLGTTFSSRFVGIYATPYGGSERVVKIGNVDSSGHLRATYKMLARTTFFVRFSGDEHYGYAAKAVAAADAVNLHMSIYGWYGTSGNYHLFHAATRQAALVVQVTPNKAGRCMRFDAQYYQSGTWHNIASLTCEQITSSSTATATFHAGAGYSARLRAVYSGDSANAARATAWNYVRFT